MKIVLSYGHSANAPLIEKTKNYLSKGAEGNLKHEVRIDTSDFKAGKGWREEITKGAFESAVPQVQPEKATKLSIYPMSIEPRTGSPSDMKDNYYFEEM